MSEIVIVPLAIALVIALKIIREIRSGAGQPSAEHQQRVTRRDRGQAIQKARWQEQNDRQQLARQQREAAERAQEDAAAREYDSRFGWNGKKWEWD